MATTAKVSIGSKAFSPAAVTIHPGDTVRFENGDSKPHSVTDDGVAKDCVCSGDLAPGQSYDRVFPKAGTFPLHCKNCSEMKCTVTVS